MDKILISNKLIYLRYSYLSIIQPFSVSIFEHFSLCTFVLSSRNFVVNNKFHFLPRRPQRISQRATKINTFKIKLLFYIE